MAKECVFCGKELKLFECRNVYCCGTEQPSCPSCYAEVKNLSQREQGRRALETGRAVAADLLRSELERHESESATKRERVVSDVACLRCGAPMLKMGVQTFQLGVEKPFLGDLPHLLSGGLSLEVMCCEKCRKVEFFLPENADPLEQV